MSLVVSTHDVIALPFCTVAVSVHTYVVQQRAIATVLDAHCQDLDVTTLSSDLESIGALTTDQFQKVASLVNKKKQHDALLYVLIVQDDPDTFYKFKQCLRKRDEFLAAALQGEFGINLRFTNIIFSLFSTSE